MVETVDYTGVLCKYSGFEVLAAQGRGKTLLLLRRIREKGRFGISKNRYCIEEWELIHCCMHPTDYAYLCRLSTKHTYWTAKEIQRAEILNERGQIDLFAMYLKLQSGHKRRDYKEDSSRVNENIRNRGLYLGRGKK